MRGTNRVAALGERPESIGRRYARIVLDTFAGRVFTLRS
jgi:hypothetical protein